MDTLKKLPLQIYLKEVNALICHASPNSNKEGWRDGIDEKLAEQFKQTPADLIVCGHWHLVREENWQGKRLVMVGSVGVPLQGKPEAEYSIFERRGRDWKIENRYVQILS